MEVDTMLTKDDLAKLSPGTPVYLRPDRCSSGRVRTPAVRYLVSINRTGGTVTISGTPSAPYSDVEVRYFAEVSAHPIQTLHRCTSRSLQVAEAIQVLQEKVRNAEAELRACLDMENLWRDAIASSDDYRNAARPKGATPLTDDELREKIITVLENDPELREKIAGAHERLAEQGVEFPMDPEDEVEVEKE